MRNIRQALLRQQLLALIVFCCVVGAAERGLAQSNEVKKSLIQAQKLHQQKDHRGAEALLARILKTDPALADAQRLLGHVLLAQKKPVRARAAFVEAFKHGRATTDVLARLCQIDRESGKPELCLPYARMLTALEPDNKNWRLLLIDTLSLVGRFHEAQLQLDTVIKLEPLKASHYLRRSNLYLKLEQSNQARRSLMNAWYLGERTVEIARSIAELFHADQNLSNALNWYETASQMATEPDVQKLRRAQVLAEMSQWQRANAVLAALSAGATASQKRQKLKLQAFIAQRQGNSNLALKLSEALLEAGGGSQATFIYLVHSYRKQQPERVVVLCEKYAKRFDSLELRLLKIDALGQQKQWTKVHEHLIDIISVYGLKESVRQRIQWLARNSGK